MAYCGPQGIPHSRFLGRDDGPEWLPEDRAKAMAWMADDGERCSMCGTAAWEWDPKQGGSLNAYVPIKHTCEGCNRKEHAKEKEDPKGTYVFLIPQDVYTRRELEKQRR